jgi:methylthioribulose-1-phosphate dehydratase
MDLSEAALQIVAASHAIEARGWAPATSGNYSVRLDETRIAITASGCSKATLSPEDVVEVDMLGRALGEGRPSAETLLHVTAYGLDASIGAIVHTHSVANTVLGRLLEGERYVELSGYELLKAVPGVTTHSTRIVLPIFENTQNLSALAAALRAAWISLDWGDAGPSGYLIRGHGLYTWGADLASALNALEAFEFLLTCEIEIRRSRV